jgi:transcriptional regulator with XRE-family HTH domain
MSKYYPTKRYATVTPGEAIRMLRMLQEMSQVDLARATGIPQPGISALESGKEKLGVERAETLAQALKVHPVVLLYPNFGSESAQPAKVRTHKEARAKRHKRAS